MVTPASALLCRSEVDCGGAAAAAAAAAEPRDVIREEEGGEGEGEEKERELTCDIIIIIIIITACCRKIRKRFMECSRNRGGESDAEKFFSASLTGGKRKKAGFCAVRLGTPDDYDVMLSRSS